MEPPLALEPRSPDLPSAEERAVGDDAAEVDLEPQPPVITPDPLASRLIPGELAILSVVAAIVLVAGWIALEFAGMVTAPPDASPIASPAPTVVAGSPSPGATTGPGPTGSGTTPSRSPAVTPPASFPVVALAPADPVAGRWRQIAPAPIGGRINAALAWSGVELLVWGGFNGEARWGDGGAYNPATNRWRRLPKSPMAARTEPASAWTGTELLVWGGYRVRFADDGAAYDPATNRWRRLSDAPLEPAPPGGAWTGARFAVVTGTPAAALYDPVTDEWERLEPPPIEPGNVRVAAVAERVFVVRQAPDGDQPRSLAVYDPADRSWRRLPDGPPAVGDAPISLVAVGSLLVVGDAVFDTEAETWSTLDLEACPFQAGLAVATDALLLSRTAAIDFTKGTCATMPRMPTRPGRGERLSAASVWTGRDWIAWSGSDEGPSGLYPKDGVAFRPTP